MLPALEVEERRGGKRESATHPMPTATGGGTRLVDPELYLLFLPQYSKITPPGRGSLVPLVCMRVLSLSG